MNQRERRIAAVAALDNLLAAPGDWGISLDPGCVGAVVDAIERADAEQPDAETPAARDWKLVDLSLIDAIARCMARYGGTMRPEDMRYAVNAALRACGVRP